MTENEKENNQTLNETSQIQENVSLDSPSKSKRSSKSRRKSRRNEEDEPSQDMLSSSMGFIVDQEEVLELLKEIANQINSTKNRLNIESFLTQPLEDTKKLQEEVEENPSIAKEDSKKYVAELKKIVKEISDSWNPPLTNSVRDELSQIRVQLNKTITLLHGSEAPTSEFKELEVDSFNQYIVDISTKIDDPNKFFTAVTKASHLVINRDVGLLEEGLKDLSEYINNKEAPYDKFVNSMYYAFLYYQSAAINTSYFGRKHFESNIKTFFESQPEDLKDVCFEILEHFYTIMLKANPRSIEKDHDTIVKDLYYSLASPSKMDYAHTCYYLKTYSLDTRHLLFFKETLNDIKSCFHGQNDPTKIDFNEAMTILRNDVSAGFLNYSPTLPKKFSSEPLKIVDSKDLPIIDEKANSHYYLSDRLILNSLIPNGFEFKYKESVNPESTELAYVQIYNELSLPQWEINRNQTYVHVPSVGQSSRYISNSANTLSVKFTEIGKVYKSNFKQEINSAPVAHRLAKPLCFKFSISSIKLFDCDVDGLTGMIYVLDGPSDLPTTEPLFFTTNNKQVSFLDSKDKEAIFPINGTKDQYLVIRLLHQQSINISQFNKFIRDPTQKTSILQSPYNFAVSAIPLLDDEGNLTKATSFPERFSLLSQSPNLASNSKLFEQLSKEAVQSIPVTTNINIEKVEISQSQTFSRSFYRTSDKSLLISSIKSDNRSVDPIITLSNIRFTFKNPPKGVYVYFTAFYVNSEENIKNPKGLPVILNYSSKDPQKQYLSTTINTSKNCIFPDVIRIIIKDSIPRNGHIIFHFYTTTSDEKQGYQAKIYKAAVLPLYTIDGVPQQSDSNVEITSFEFKEVQPNKYLYPSKISSQSKVLMSVSIPPVYTPFPLLRELLSKKPSDDVPIYDISKFSAEINNDSFVPMVARYLTIMSPSNTLSFVRYLGQFNPTTIGPAFVQYAYRIFNPMRISADFPNRFFSSYSAAVLPWLKADGTSDNILNLIYFLKTCQYFLHIASVTILTLHKEKKPIDGSLLQDVIKFSKCVSTLISTTASLVKSTEVNKAFSAFMHIIVPIIGYENGLQIISDHLIRFNSGALVPLDLTPLFPPPPEVKSKHDKIVEPPIPKPGEVSEDMIVRGLQMKLHFIKIFANSNNMLANCAYNEKKTVKIFENLFSSLKLSMTKARELVPDYILLLSEFVRTIENFPEISLKCANVYIPYLDFAVEFVNNDIFNDYQLFQHFLVPILFVLHTADKQTLYKYYDDLICGQAKDDKKTFIEFLDSLIVRTLTPNPAVAKPAAPLDISECANSEEEYKKLQEVAAISKDINYVIYNELTVRILDFVSDYFYRAKSIDITDKQAEAFSSLFDRITGYHQLKSNFDDAMLTIAKFVDNYYSKIYFNHTESYNKLVDLSLRLVSRNLRVARAAGVAMTIHLMYIDYHTTENVIASMHYFYQNLVKAIYHCPKYRVAVYKSFLDRLKLFITSYRYEEFVSLFNQHFGHAKTIYESAASMRGYNKSPELQVKMMNRIADQLYPYPLLRLHWLREIVQCNKKEYFYAQAFEGQVQVVALIDKMIRLIKTENIPEDLDYSFVEQTSDESKIDITHCKDHLRHMLIKDLNPADDIFNQKGLINNLNYAIKLGKSAGLPWEVRECYYNFLNVYESMRDIKELRKKATKLGDIYNTIYNRQEKLDMPIFSAQASSQEMMLSQQSSANNSANLTAQMMMAAAAANGEDSDTFKPELLNSVDPTSTPLYFYLVEWRRQGKLENRLIYASTISDLRQFTDFLNNPSQSRFDYGANAAAYHSTYEAELKESTGIVVSPVKPVEDPSFGNKIFEFTQDVHCETNNLKDAVHKRYIFRTRKPQPNLNIISRVRECELKEFNRLDDMQLVVSESIAAMERERKVLFSSLPTLQNDEKWMKVKPSLPLMPLSKAINDAVNGTDLALPTLKDGKKRFTDKNNLAIVSRLARQWTDEVEKSLSVLLTVSKRDVQNLERNMNNYEHLKNDALVANADLFKNKQLTPGEIPLNRDPLLYFRDYEEF